MKLKFLEKYFDKQATENVGDGANHEKVGEVRFIEASCTAVVRNEWSERGDEATVEEGEKYKRAELAVFCRVKHVR